jgi:hypothetical protein
VGLVYDPRGLPGVTTARPGVAGVLQIPLVGDAVICRIRSGLPIGQD